MGKTNRLVAWLLCLSLIAGACDLWPSDEPQPEADEVALDVAGDLHRLTDDGCDDLGLARASGVPLDGIAVEGWPGSPGEDWGLVVAQLTTGSEPEDGGGFVAVVADWVDPVVLTVPVHPSEDPEGGAVEVRFGQQDGDDTFWCDSTHELEIEPLPPAGRDEGVEAQLQDAHLQLEAIAAVFDTTGVELASLDPSRVDDHQLPLYITARLLHDDAIRQMLDELDASERDLADRLVAQARRSDPGFAPTSYQDALAFVPDALGGSLTTTPAGVVTVAALPDGVVPVALTSPATMSVPSSPEPPAVLATPMAGGAGACTSVTFDGLAQLLGRQHSGETMLSDRPGAFIDGAITFAGLPYIGRWGLPTVLTAWVTKATAEYLANMLPALYEGTAFEYDPRELWEDDLVGGEFESLTMRFSSHGWDAGPVLAELAVILADQGLSRALRRYLKPLAPVRGAPGTTELWGETVWKSIEAMDLANEARAEVLSWFATHVVSTLIEASGVAEGVTTFGPSCWEAENRSPDLDPTFELRYLDAIQRGDWWDHYVARDLGTGLLEAEWEVPIGQHFLGPVSAAARAMTATFTTRAPVEVVPLEVVWAPARARVRPGEAVTLHLTTRNANDDLLRVTDPYGHLDVLVRGANTAEIVYYVPEDWDLTPIELVATSMSSEGLRAPGHPAYRGEVTGSAWLSADEEEPEVDEPCAAGECSGQLSLSFDGDWSGSQTRAGIGRGPDIVETSMSSMQWTATIDVRAGPASPRTNGAFYSLEASTWQLSGSARTEWCTTEAGGWCLGSEETYVGAGQLVGYPRLVVEDDEARLELGNAGPVTVSRTYFSPDMTGTEVTERAWNLPCPDAHVEPLWNGSIWWVPYSTHIMDIRSTEHITGSWPGGDQATIRFTCDQEWTPSLFSDGWSETGHARFSASGVVDLSAPTAP